jgi:hypothetical protein
MTTDSSNDAPGEHPKLPEPDMPAWARRASNEHPMTDDRMAVFIGDKWESTYKRKFAPFLEDPSFVPTWNWSAALATPYWFLYRKLYLPFVLFLFAPGVAARLLMGSESVPAVNTLAQPEMQQTTIISAAFMLSAMIAAGGTANWLLFRRARAATMFVAQQQLPEPEARVMLGRLGGVHRGPTILLVVLFLAIMMAQILGQRPA